MSSSVANFLTLHTGKGAGREVLTECLVAPNEVFNPDEPAVRMTVNSTRQPRRTLATLDLTIHETRELIRQLTEANVAAVVDAV